MPMIPLGLKETTSVDFGDVLRDFVLEHYSEDGDQYQNEINEFNDAVFYRTDPLLYHNFENMVIFRS